MSLPALSSDCSSCFGLCCVLLPFSREAGFGTTKPGGTPCHHLDGHDRCGIHDSLRERGWPGCTVFECFGAGQHVSQVTYGGVSWREHDNLGEMAAVLSVVRILHEVLALLVEAAERGSAEASALQQRVVALAAGTPEEVLSVDVDDVRAEVSPVLAAVSAAVRREGGADLARADLAGKDLRGLDLRDASLRGALLIRADLRGADLTRTDLLGADLRDADVRGARLGDALFLTQPQANAALGDAATALPHALARPGHWARR